MLGAGGGQGWGKDCVIDKGASEDHKLPTLRKCTGALVVIPKISLLPVQACKADGVVPRGISITHLDIEADASAGKAL
jgi:hypothetical protein